MKASCFAVVFILSSRCSFLAIALASSSMVFVMTWVTFLVMFFYSRSLKEVVSIPYNFDVLSAGARRSSDFMMLF